MQPATSLPDASAPDDHALMAAIGGGDQRAYEKLVSRHLGRAVGFAYKMLGNRADAEDVAQDAFFKVWSEAPRWKPQALFSTWFYRVLYNLCIDSTRRSKIPHVEMNEEYADDRQSVEEELDQRHEDNLLRLAIAGLPEKQRAALVMFHYEELSQSQTAQALAISESALESLLFRARKILKEALGT